MTPEQNDAMNDQPTPAKGNIIHVGDTVPVMGMDNGVWTTVGVATARPAADDEMTQPTTTTNSEKIDMTIQQITDRLAEEAGWKPEVVDDGLGETFTVWHRHGAESTHPFPPNSIDAAVRALGDKTWLLGTLSSGTFRAIVGGLTYDASHPAHAIYYAAAKARGWM